jgi:hypothetical protein
MKFIYILFLIPLLLFSKAEYVSPIPPTANIFIDLDDKECNNNCLKELYKRGLIFTLLSKVQLPYSRGDLVLDLKEVKKFIEKDNGKLDKIAIVMSSRDIGTYSTSTINSVLAFLLDSEKDFDLEVFDIKNESKSEIKLALLEIKGKGIKRVIAPFTTRGAEAISSIESDLIIYIPTVNRKSVSTDSVNIYFGGVDYEKQIDLLLKYTSPKVAIFDDGGKISKSLTKEVKKRIKYNTISYSIEDAKVNFKRLFKNNKKLKNRTVYLNTPLVTSSLIASQLSYYDLRPKAILSTQVNYHPMLLSLTQNRDRKNMYIANSISKLPFTVLDIGSNLGINPRYDWINYSTILGVDHIFSLESRLNQYESNFDDNQLMYNVSLYMPTYSRFIKVLGE